MSDMNCHDAQQQMNAYLDGELDLVRNLEMEGHLQTCPTCARILGNQRTLQETLRSDAFYYRAPLPLQAWLRSSLGKTRPRPTRPRIWVFMGAAAASIAIVGFTLGWMSARKDLSTEDLLAREVISSHVRSLMASHLTDVASSDQHTVKPWFKGQLDFSPPVKDLSKEDFSLVGGRVDYVGDRSVAAIVYQRRKHFINLFVWPSPSDSATSQGSLTLQGFHLIRWNKDGLAYWAVSDLNEKELDEFVRLVRKESG
jgi:anti-sigma factor RsiW